MSGSTRIRFFIGSEQPEKDFCRLIASAYRHGHQVQVLCSDHAQVEAMNQALWKFPDGDFVPHCTPQHHLAEHTPVWLTTEINPAHFQVLVNLAKTLSGNSTDPEVVARAIADFYTPNGLYSDEAYVRAVAAFKWEVPQNYYDNGLWNLDWPTAPAQTALLLRNLSRLPEFQLM